MVLYWGNGVLAPPMAIGAIGGSNGMTVKLLLFSTGDSKSSIKIIVVPFFLQSLCRKLYIKRLSIKKNSINQSNQCSIYVCSEAAMLRHCYLLSLSSTCECVVCRNLPVAPFILIRLIIIKTNPWGSWSNALNVLAL